METKLIVITGPSGVGKATIEEKLFSMKELNISFSCSATTREPRVGEKHGEHYYFLSREDFIQKINNNEFLEFSEHFNNMYGTLASEVDRIMESGKWPFLEIETNGAREIMAKFPPNKLITIFIAPPSMAALKDRIITRNTETSKQQKIRSARADEELEMASQFQHIVINDDLDKAVNTIASIIRQGKK